MISPVHLPTPLLGALVLAVAWIGLCFWLLPRLARRGGAAAAGRRSPSQLVAERIARNDAITAENLRRRHGEPLVDEVAGHE